ncbi:mitochondrial carrier domain-containing protein [Scheffersomyces coipomensis]|uniref:mitochondrial carrier domain-containing protein n=1 Tax=Scheffersomyces coipomensis TaxID=1788519 RepID=UPI00315DDFCF
MSLSSELAAAIEDPDFILAGSKLKQKVHSSDISLSQRMLSAFSGSLITSMVVTPFDVIRVRIQQQEILPMARPCCEPEAAIETATTSSASTINAALKAHGLPKSTAAGLDSSAPELFWLQHYCKSADNCTKITSTFQGFTTVARNEGIATLWRGLSITLLMAIPSNIVYFTGYEYLRDNLPTSKHPLNPLVCGSFARILSSTCVAPFELVKTRLQSIPAGKSSSPKVLSNLIKDSFATVKQMGVGTLFTGLQITLWRDAPFSGIYWLCYELLKSSIGNALKADFDHPKGGQDDWKVFTTSFLSGSISGTVAAFFTNPFDVGKTRLQITSQHKIKKGNKYVYPSMFSFLADIYRKEGMGALYAGFVPRVLKIAPACAIMISSYEVGKVFFKTGNSNHNNHRDIHS